MEKQRTIKKSVSLKGKGIHTAVEAEIIFSPASVDSGINFLRTDLPQRTLVKANVSNILNVKRSPRRTSIGVGNVEIHTIEHLMAALSGLGIDNILIEINNSEVPGLDGSALGFVKILKSAGICEQDVPRKFISVKEPIIIQEEDNFIAIKPDATFRISYTLHYENKFLNTEYLDLDINQGVFESQIAPARTFCLEEEVGILKNMGLGKGADYNNTLVVSKNGVVNNKVRFEDEFIRHKISDLIGDLYLLGRPIKGHIIAVKSGHPLNMNLIKKIYQQKSRDELSGVGSAFTIDKSEELDISMIMKILPHRYPFLLVDKIIALEKGKRAVGIKNVTVNEEFFLGHFPGKPIMPGVLIIEAMAQVGGVLMLSPEENRGKLAYFMAIDKVKFRKTVVPGDQLRMEVELVRSRPKAGQVRTKAFVDDKLVAEAELTFALVES